VGDRVGLSASNNSENVGTEQVPWGPVSYSGLGAAQPPPETPLFAQYMFIRRALADGSGFEDTQLIGASSVKHFFSSAQAFDSLHLNPGQNDTYDAIAHNAAQSLFTSGSEIDPVTGELHRPSDFGPLTLDGYSRTVNRTFDDRIQY